MYLPWFIGTEVGTGKCTFKTLTPSASTTVLAVRERKQLEEYTQKADNAKASIHHNSWGVL